MWEGGGGGWGQKTDPPCPRGLSGPFYKARGPCRCSITVSGTVEALPDPHCHLPLLPCESGPGGSRRAPPRSPSSHTLRLTGMHPSTALSLAERWEGNAEEEEEEEDDGGGSD